MARRKTKLAEDAPAKPIDELADGAPVYDERGNVRPKGTPGARRMTHAERAAIAQALAEGETPPIPKRAPEVPLPKAKGGDDGDA